MNTGGGWVQADENIKVRRIMAPKSSIPRGGGWTRAEVAQKKGEEVGE